jgi:hypothetical protein
MSSTISTWLRRRVAAGVVGALALTGATLVASPESGITSRADAAAAQCSTDRSSTEFGGEAISQTYANLFNKGTPAASYLTDFVPQGLGVWENWRGGTSSEDLFLVGMHHEDENANRSLLYGMTTRGTVRGYARLPVGSHAGGVKVHQGWVYVQHDNSRILRYPVSRIRQAFTDSTKRNLGWGAATNAVTDVSFFDIDGGYLYGGYHNATDRGHMFRYRIQGDGNLVQDHGWGPIQIPTKAQGLLVLSNTWIFSTSRFRDHRGNVYAIRRGYPARTDFTTTRYRCFQSVAMIQELVGFNGRTYLLNESGASEFADGRIHNIRNLHVANTESLRSLVW